MSAALLSQTCARLKNAMLQDQRVKTDPCERSRRLITRTQHLVSQLCAICGLCTRLMPSRHSNGGDWYCKGCVARPPLAYALVGKQVDVFWPHDNTWYSGRIDAFEPLSRKHRVAYEDGEWEFLDISDQYIRYKSPSILLDNGIKK